VGRFDHIVLHVRSKPVLRPEEGGEMQMRVGEHQVDDMLKAMVDRCRIADEPDALALEHARGKETCNAEGHHVRHSSW
jgi:hypothetical protein